MENRLSNEESMITDFDPQSWHRQIWISVYFQGEYKITNWIITDEFLPKSMPRNINGIVTLKVLTNISNKNIEIGKVLVYAEFKWAFFWIKIWFSQNLF